MSVHVRRWPATLAVALLLATAAAVPASASPAAGAPRAAAPPAVQAVPTNDWLHTVGNTIVDEAGNRVVLSGANWFGYNASERVFHGLWSANIETLTRQMAERGINIVRVPISTQLLLEWRAGQTVAAPNVNTFANPELAGLNNLQIFDYWLMLCERYGLKVLLDVHSAEADNSGHVYPVWYKGSVTAEQFYVAWEWVTTRYRNNDTIVAPDFLNEAAEECGDTPPAHRVTSVSPPNCRNADSRSGVPARRRSSSPVPRAMTRPERMKSRSSHRSASSITWLETTIVAPPATSDRKCVQNWARRSGSTPTVGSSRNSNGGEWTSAQARESRRR